MAREMGTPAFVYDLDRFGENVRRLGDAFERAGLPVRQRFALKANREPEVLAALRGLGAPGEPGSVGIDACSPGEVLHALEHGWRPEEISFTGTNVSERDLDVLLAHPIHINLDAVSQVERVGVGRRAPTGPTDRPAGQPRRGRRLSRGPGLQRREADEVRDLRGPARRGTGRRPRRHGLTVDTVHVHAGSGWLGRRPAGVRSARSRRPRR